MGTCNRDCFSTLLFQFFNGIGHGAASGDNVIDDSDVFAMGIKFLGCYFNGGSIDACFLQIIVLAVDEGRCFFTSFFCPLIWCKDKINVFFFEILGDG